MAHGALIRMLRMGGASQRRGPMQRRGPRQRRWGNLQPPLLHCTFCTESQRTMCPPHRTVDCPRALGLWKQPGPLPLACRLHIDHLRPLLATRCVLLPDPWRQSMFHVRLSGTLGARLLRNTNQQRLPCGRSTLHAVPDAEMPVLPVMSPPACQSIAPMALQSATSATGPTPLPCAHRWCASSATNLATPPGLAISRPSAPDVVGQDTTAAKAWLTTGPALMRSARSCRASVPLLWINA